MSSPIYIQIHNDIRKAIEAGKWAIGDRIPSERSSRLRLVSVE